MVLIHEADNDGVNLIKRLELYVFSFLVLLVCILFRTRSLLHCSILNLPRMVSMVVYSGLITVLLILCVKCLVAFGCDAKALMSDLIIVLSFLCLDIGKTLLVPDFCASTSRCTSVRIALIFLLHKESEKYAPVNREFG